MNPIYKFTLNKGTTNLLDAGAVSDGFYVAPPTGELVENHAYQTSDYIPVSGGATYHLLNDLDLECEMMYLAFYDKDSNYISGTSGVYYVTAPALARFMRVSFGSNEDASEMSLCLMTVTTFAAYVNTRAYPLFGELSKEWNTENNQQFFREKLSGKLKFVVDDYAFIMAKPFDFHFLLTLYMSYDAGQTWRLYWEGDFYKTDCEIDEDAECITVTPSSRDRYAALLDGYDKEFDLIKLCPEIVRVQMDKRPMVQIYVPGESVVGCFLSGMHWEQECDAVAESDLSDYFFRLNTTQWIWEIGGGSPDVSGIYTGAAVVAPAEYSYRSGAYEFVGAYFDTHTNNYCWRIVEIATDTVLYEYTDVSAIPPDSIVLDAVQGSGATGSVVASLSKINVYARYLMDVNTFRGNATHDIPMDDMCPDNRNYHKVIGYDLDVIAFSSRLGNTPTEYGIYQPGQYYLPPDDVNEYFPVARDSWGRTSIWFKFSAQDWSYEAAGRKAYTLKDAYPLSSVISVLLREIAPELTHAATTDYSQFLYGTNPLDGTVQTLIIAQKSNLITSGYDQPAQKAPITLKAVMDMLRDCYRCYCFIDDLGRFRIEHIDYFMNGGNYRVPPADYFDLTAQVLRRNGKAWDYARNTYTFDKPETVARYQFGWADDCTRPFMGFPIDILSGYVQKDKVEDVQVATFTSDVDYILLNPSEISKDGFVLMGAVLSDGVYTLPYLNFHYNNADHLLQNAYAAFIYLQDYYAYDMPAKMYKINGVVKTALGQKWLKKQNINFPAYYDLDLSKLVKTNIGFGMIGKISVNLSSRVASATLKYKTEGEI